MFMNWDKSRGRDNKMYRLSEISNLEKKKPVYRIDHRLYLPNSVLQGQKKRSSSVMRAY